MLESELVEDILRVCVGWAVLRRKNWRIQVPGHLSEPRSFTDCISSMTSPSSAPSSKLGVCCRLFTPRLKVAPDDRGGHWRSGRAFSFLPPNRSVLNRHPKCQARLSGNSVKEGAGSVWLTLRGSDPAEAWAQHSRPHTSLITYCPVWFSFSFSNALQTQRPSFPPSRGFLFPATSQHGLSCFLSQKVLLGGVACL